MKKIISWLGHNALYLSFGIVLTATLGSLFFSEVMNLPPCVLCWYQRIFIYPLFPIFLVGILRRDPKVHWYAWPLIIPGLLVSVFHNLLYWKLLPEAAAPCVAGVSCTTKFFEWFGFITIPFLSLAAFITLTILMVIYTKRHKINLPQI